MLQSSRLDSNRSEGLGFGREVTPPDTPSVAPPDQLPPVLDHRRGAGSTLCRTPDLSERHVPEVVQFLDFSGVIREELEEVAPPPADSLVAAIVTLQRADTGLNLDLIVHEREQCVEVTAVEGLIQEHGQIHVLARHPPPSIAGTSGYRFPCRGAAP